MQRTDELDLIQNAARLFQNQLNVRAVFSHNVGQIPPCVVQPVPVEIDLVGKQLAVQCAKGAESVGGEQDAVRGVEGHHDLRPVNHGGEHKCDDMLAEAEGITLRHLDGLMCVHSELKLTHQHKRLLVADDYHLWPAKQDFLN
ncbi:hypothetical protein SDC9_169866 [bioreactor metagenome]|uniref:Uncharacterized protein n=1 Tax=bioreactor metagenome TaxID=1076179 RepID=A0A645GFC6_9ZZZZ